MVFRRALKGMSSIANLSHTFRINYMVGTNDSGIFKKINRASGSVRLRPHTIKRP